MQAWPRSPIEFGAVGLCCKPRYLFQGRSPSSGHIPTLLPYFPRSLCPQKLMCKWYGDNVGPPIGYYPKEVPEPQKVPELKMWLWTSTVLSKHNPCLPTKQGSERLLKPAPHL